MRVADSHCHIDLPNFDVDREACVSRAREAGVVQFHYHQLRDWATNKARAVDDKPYGGGAGMVMMIEPIDNCISKLKADRAYDDIIYMSPDGELLTQPIANELSLKKNLILLLN